MEYVYCYCESVDDKVNPEFRHYVRLYKKDNGEHILVDQGKIDKIPSWESHYKATQIFDSPYPHLD